MPQRAMPAFTKSPPDLVERFGAVLDDFPDAERKKMFGYPAAFVGGNMATGLFANAWFVRLPESEIDAAIASGAQPAEVMPGKSMKAFVGIPVAEIADDARVRAWVERGLAAARALPAKR